MLICTSGRLLPAAIAPFTVSVKRLGIILGLALLVAMLAVGIDRLTAQSLAKRVRAVRIGDSQQQVAQLVGRPVGTFTPLPEAQTNMVAAILSVRSETWAYGSRLNLRHPFEKEFPYFLPIRFRLFHPDADDVSIEFDSSGRVSRITIP